MTVLRPARADDVDALRRLPRAAFQHYTARIRRPPVPIPADYTDLVARGTTWVAEEDGAVTGFVVLLDQPDHMLLDILAVAPDAQGRGVGAGLLRLAEQQATRRGRPEIRLCTNEAMTENLDYYPRRGYVETHRSDADGFHRVFFAKVLAAA